MIIFKTDIKVITDSSVDSTTDSKLNELLNDVEFYRLMQYQNVPSNEEK